MAVPKSTPTSEKGYATRKSFWGFGDEETPELIWPLSVEVYDRMRRQDAQVISVLRAVTLPIRRTTWRVDPNGARPEVVQLVADDLGLPIRGQEPKPTARTRDRFSWPEHLRLALLMLPFGHSYFEQVYRIVNGQARLRKLAWRPPRTITHIEVADDGGLEWINQGAATPLGDVKITVDRLVAYVNDREGGNWLGQSLLRPAYKDWLLKDRTLRTQQQVIDRNGMGIPTYEASPVPAAIVDSDEIVTRQQAEVDAGDALMQALRAGENAGMAFPNGAKVNLMGVTGALPDIDKPIRYHDEQIARAVLANFLSLGGDNSTGSYALGETFANFFILSLQTVAGQIADTATAHIVEDIVDLNFGDSEPAPRLVFDEIGSHHAATSEAIRALVECGALTPDDALELHLRTTYGLPASDPATARPRAATKKTTIEEAA